MVSEMAIEDLDRMRAEGLSPSARDAVRLNAFGVRVERAADAAELYALPRCAFLGPLAFREPTIGHKRWIDEVAACVDMTDVETELILYAFAVSRPIADLPPSTDRAAVRDAVEQFTRGPVAAYTSAQLRVAVFYALMGCDAADGESAPARAIDEEGRITVPESIAAGVLHEGVAVGLGLSLADLSQLTLSHLRAMIDHALALRGRDIRKSAHGRAFGQYCAARDEIIARLKEERAAADGR